MRNARHQLNHATKNSKQKSDEEKLKRIFIHTDTLSRSLSLPLFLVSSWSQELMLLAHTMIFCAQEPARSGDN